MESEGCAGALPSGCPPMPPFVMVVLSETVISFVSPVRVRSLEVSLSFVPKLIVRVPSA